MTKFVILCFIRTGTHMLSSALGSHPDIYCDWEIFNPINPHLSPPREMIKNVWDKKEVSGFPIHFENDARDSEWLSLWDILKKQHIRFIYLHRKNILKQFCSHKKADITGAWNSPVSTKQKLQLTINTSEMISYLEKMDHWQHKAREYLSGQQYIEVLYEDLPAKLNDIQNFLGVEVLDLIPSTVKLDNRDIKDIIRNFQEVETSLKKNTLGMDVVFIILLLLIYSLIGIGAYSAG